MLAGLYCRSVPFYTVLYRLQTITLPQDLMSPGQFNKKVIGVILSVTIFASYVPS